MISGAAAATLITMSHNFTVTPKTVDLKSGKSLNPNSGKMVLWGTGPPSSLSAGFQNKVTVPCPNNSSLKFLACGEQNKLGLSNRWKPSRTLQPPLPRWECSINSISSN